MSTKDNTILNQIEEQRVVAIDRLIIGVTLLALVGVPISCFRALYTGWSMTYAIHVALLAVLIVTSLLRARLTTEQKDWIILSTGILVCLLGLFTYGLVGNGLLWGMFTVLVSIYFLKDRITYLVMTVIFCAFGLSAFQFVHGEKTFPGDADIYLAQTFSWGTALLGSAVFIVLIASISAGLRRQTNDLLLALERKNRELDQKNVEISRLADFDDLTGLPVFRQFKKAAEHALVQSKREDRFVAVCFMDIDGFKVVNDTLGHDAGNDVLKLVAQRLSTHVRQEDLAARVGGDEFVILINSAYEVDLDTFCSRLLATIREPHIYESEPLNISVSIGVACLTEESSTVETLLKRADDAMYEVKRQGKNNYLIT